jgi:hypothetical protein
VTEREGGRSRCCVGGKEAVPRRDFQTELQEGSLRGCRMCWWEGTDADFVKARTFLNSCTVGTIHVVLVGV